MSAAAVAVCLFAPATASAANPRVAALQVALRAHDAYSGAVDGIAGPGTTAGVRRIQARAGLVVDGSSGPRTRRALGRQGRHAVGSRPLRQGHRGWDVAALQFALETRGFPCGTVDGGFGARTEAAVRRAQAFAGLRGRRRRRPGDARRPLPPAGRERRRCGSRSKRRSATATARAAPASTPGSTSPRPAAHRVTAAASGRVAFAGWDDGWGLTVTLDHGNGLRNRYAHLSRATVRPGTAVAAGTTIGRVGATGFATGPHLHFEVTIRGANADPAPAFAL